jgi:hypothetical protein
LYLLRSRSRGLREARVYVRRAAMLVDEIRPYAYGQLW